MPGEEMLIPLLKEASDKYSAMPLQAAQVVAGFVNKKKAKKEAAELAASRPKLQSSPYLKDQLSLAKNELSNGLSAEAESAYTQSTDRDLSNSLDAILKNGGSVNDISSVFDSSQMGRSRFAIMKENMRLNQINNLVRAQDASEEQRQKMFQFNDFMPWADRAQANAGARKGAEEQIWNGLAGLAGTTMKAGAGASQQQDYSNYLNPGTGNNGFMSQVSSAPARMPNNYNMGNTGNIDMSNRYPSINLGG